MVRKRDRSGRLRKVSIQIQRKERKKEGFNTFLCLFKSMYISLI